MKVLNFGSCNIDYVYTVDRIVISGETKESSSLEVFSGGKGLNQSIAIAKAGTKVYHAGCVGNDGEMLISVLEENEVDVSLVKRVDDKTGHAIIQLTDDGQNSIILYRGANGLLSKEYIDEVLKDFCCGDVLLLQNETNNVDYIIDSAYEKGLKIFFNPAPFSEQVKKIDFSKISYLIVNEIEAQGIGGKSTPEENVKHISEKYQSINVILTVGSKGAFYTDCGEIKYQPAMKVDVVDTTAAGDTFIGYLLSGITKGDTIVSAVKRATVASAIAVTKKGAAVSIPKRDEVIMAEKILKPNLCAVDKNQILKDKIVKYLQDNLCVASLNGLAKTLCYSNGYTSELINKLFGKPFSELLIDMRCNLAAELLINTDLSVAEIIYNVGYENASFFRKIFKNRYGKTPYAFKKMKKGDSDDVKA
ncbi:MAG: helix-turn-helix domain-containing protein [Clostridia bacterium]|nr:helix-turn-helix domain-containing protein [Clostridia bacterium]